MGELNRTVSKMNERIDELKTNADRQQRRSRQSCILIHMIV